MSYTGVTKLTPLPVRAVVGVIETLRSDVVLPGANVSCAAPSALVTVPPVVAETSVGGARAFAEDDESVAGVTLVVVSSVVTVLVACAVESEPVTVLLLVPDAVPDAAATSTLSLPPCFTLAVPSAAV
jgi:hypothetical protein